MAAANQPASAPRSVPPPGKALPRETPQQAARRLALITLVDRVADVFDLSQMQASPAPDEALTQKIDRWLASVTSGGSPPATAP